MNTIRSMVSNHRSRNKLIAFCVFAAALGLYLSTMAPTASFWDAGEFIAVAHGLQVNHPPGAPLYSLVGRLFCMFMPPTWVAPAVNAISSLAAAGTIMLLYLIVVRLVREFRGYDTDRWAPIDRIGMYGGAVLGATAFAVTDTFWFNAVEAEVYAVSMLFTAIVVWLALKWSENHAEPGNERWLLLIAYMFGLALGVHLLNLLAVFFVGLVIYFKKQQVSPASLAIAAGLAVAAFLTIYPFTVQMLPQLMENLEQATYGLIGPVTFTILVVALLGGGLWFTHTRGHRMVNFVLLAYMLILVGYSSYALIFIRSRANPPIDENNPETAQKFIDYLERKQYGQTPLLSGYDYDAATGRINREQKVLLPRRYDPNHTARYARYDSDWDYFLRYQLTHMYIRYFNWNFIGRDSDIQDAPWQAGFTKSAHAHNPAHNSYFYLPLLLGLFGLLFHFQRDWRRALAVGVLFVMTGVAIIVFLNQTPAQPRERDYAYVGSFFAFALWIGLGGVGLVELVKDYLKSSRLAAYALLGAAFLGVPAQMGWQNYNDHDRSDRYVAADYAYNLLQSVDYGGILFTNGDNDTFPLWYAQEVEGVRTDVRIVCLSLLNTDWYIRQLRDQWSHQSAPLPISLTDQQIKEITTNRYLHQPDTVRIPVNKPMLSHAFSDSGFYREKIGAASQPSARVFKKSVDFGMPVDSLDDQLAWYYKGRPAGQDQQGNPRYYTMVQDDVILNMLKTNHWLRPVYFATSVANESQLNLQNYFRFEGMAFRVVPRRRSNVSMFGYINPDIMANTYRKFRFRDWNRDNYLDENIRRTAISNFMYGLLEYTDHYIQNNKPDRAAKWLEWGQKNLPFYTKYGERQTMLMYAYNYARADKPQKAMELAEECRKPEIKDLQQGMNRMGDIQQKVSKLNDDIKRARANADMSGQSNLQQRIRDITDRRQQIGQNISRTLLNLIIIQRIDYMNNADDKARTLINTVQEITGGSAGFPQNREENEQKIDQFF